MFESTAVTGADASANDRDEGTATAIGRARRTAAESRSAGDRSGAWGSTATGESGIAGVEFRPSTIGTRKDGRLDRTVLSRAQELLEDIENETPEGVSVSMEALRFVVAELWRSALKSSEMHRAVLAVIESALLSSDEISANRAAAFRGAFRDLAAAIISPQHLEVIQSQFIDQGYNPMALLSDLGKLDEPTQPERGK